MATARLPVSLSGANHTNTSSLLPANRGAFVKTQTLTVQSKTSSRSRNLSIQARSNRSGGGGAEFLTGFVLGGALVGTLAYMYAPQLYKIVKDENDAGFKKFRGPVYYDDGLVHDDGLENNRLNLSEKISQLNSAIDSVASRLKGGLKSSKDTKDDQIYGM